MRTTAYRVQKVLRGDASAAAVIAVDAEGREVHLEVGRLEGASIRPNEVLILSWATVQVPSPASEAAEPPAAGMAEGEDLPDRPMVEAEAEAETAATELDETDRLVEDFNEIKALMGLA